MEIKGVIHKILPVVTGTSAKGKWEKLEVVVEQPGEYAKKALIEFWGDNATSALSNLAEGMEINADINIEAREYNGRWYNTVRCWRFSSEGSPARNQPEFIKPAAKTENSEDLPF